MTARVLGVLVGGVHTDGGGERKSEGPKKKTRICPLLHHDFKIAVISEIKNGDFEHLATGTL